MLKAFNLADWLWGHRARFLYVFFAAILLLFTLLSGKEIWTQEHRWGDIVSGMFFRQDFLHPYLGENVYYDKPLLSYWLIVIASYLTGALSTFSLRLPSACAGLLAVWSIYQLGFKLQSKSLGLLAAWMLITTYYFVFWARTSSADMLNLGGSLFALAWYINKRESSTFFNYFIFFCILALTSLCKGLIGAIVPLIAVFIDMLLQQSIRKHLNLKFLFAVLLAMVVYFLPFLASLYFDSNVYGENGLYLVYRENILRYFEPFDHRGPIYTYLIYLPIYLFPWALFFIPALFSLPARFKQLSLSSKWILFTLLAVFIFFTLSGSRRSYYVLPMVPFAILFTADWLINASSTRLKTFSAQMAVTFFLLLFVGIALIPAWYYSKVGVKQFAVSLQTQASTIKPWKEWQVVLLDAESKLIFYLQLPPTTKLYGVEGDREAQTQSSLLKAWPILQNPPAQTIFITRKIFSPLIAPYFAHYKQVELPASPFLFADLQGLNASVAYIPES